MYSTYVIYSNTSLKKYTGHTEDIKQRLHQHNEGLLGIYTKNKGPWVLIHCENFESRTKAIQREKYLKTGVGRDWLKKMYNI